MTSLLILGAPGAGKTTLLLELCRDLLDRAEADETQPIPVVFNLSSWTDEQLALTEWICAESLRVYDVDPSIGKAWLDSNELAILFDGLDEVSASLRNSCIFRYVEFYQRSQAPCVLCSRTDAYEALAVRVSSGSAITIDPLPVAHLRQFLAHTPEGRELFQRLTTHVEASQPQLATPLLATLVAQSPPTTQAFDRLISTEQLLWNSYIEKAFSRRAKLSPIAVAFMQRRLAWLARQLIRDGEDTIRIEQIHPGWLPKNLQRWMTNVLPLAILFGVAVIGFMLRRYIADGLDRFTSTNPMGSSLIIAPLFSAGTVVLLAMFAMSTAQERIASLRWTWSRAKRVLEWLPLILVSPLAIAGINTTGTLRSFLLWLCIGSGVTAFLTLAAIVFFGLQPVVVATLRPGQIMHRTATISLLLTLGSIVIGVLSGLGGGFFIYGLFAWIDGIPVERVSASVFQSARNGLNFGFIVGSVLGLHFGGYAALRHASIRLGLVLSRILPLHIPRFLDACADRALLYRVGGGYIFMHRLLMEHFAALTDDDITRLSAAIDARRR